MKPADVHLWEEFIKQRPGAFDTVDYDVLGGQGVVIGDPETDPYSRSFQMLTQKKIDVVAYKGDLVEIIEIKPLAGASAMGQILAYRALWLQRHPEVDANLVSMAVITNMLQSDYEKIYSDNNIKVYIVGMCEQCSGVIQV